VPFQALGERGAGVAHDRQVLGERLVGALEHRDALLALQHPRDEIAGERPVQGQVHHADLELAGLAQVVGDGLGLHDHAALPEDHVLGVVEVVARGPLVTPSGEGVVLVHHLVGDGRDVVEEVRPLRDHRLHVGVLVLHRTREHRRVDVPEHRDTPPRLAVDELLRRRRARDDVVGPAEELGDELALRHQQRLDQVRGQEAVLADRRRGQAQFRDLARDEVEVGRLLRVLPEHLEEAGVVDAVVVVVPAVDVEARLGDRARADVQHVGQALADRCVQRLVHEGDALG